MQDAHMKAAEPQLSGGSDACLRGGGEMGARMRALDWSQTPLGSVLQWPQSLKTAVQIMLNSRYPMFVWWGREYTNLYNDAYAPILGQRHPHALGQSAPVIWADIWEAVGPQAIAVLHEGRATWNEEMLLIMERYGYPEETYFTFSYSPVADDAGGVSGVFCACTEDTTRVLGQRRLRTLRELATATVGAKNDVEACRRAATALSANPYDLPFVLLYLCDATAACARLVGTAGVAAETPGAPSLIDLHQEPDGPWPLSRVLQSGTPVGVEDLERRIGMMPGGPWPISPSQALVLPLAQAGHEQLAGVLIVGVSPYRQLDEEYRGFCSLVAASVATAIADARAYEAERQRAEALAELDRAKTTFFSNVSHEFRTPLTLMLGPLEQTLDAADDALKPSLREELAIVHRNGLRLLKLVNTLLDFARIEAGRIEARYEPTDLATVTADLASVFRSAVERAGLRLVVDCPRLPGVVYVDRDMWEKIVLNLLSNALKFTFAGKIAVRLHWREDHVELAVCDTGTGIPADELPHLFERFHRIRDARARTHEGAGIGLALVQELVHLHGGQITVASEVGVGTSFTVTIPTGSAHLPSDRVRVARHLASTAVQADAFVEEALRWLPAESATEVTGVAPATLPTPLPRPLDPTAPRILVADDNVDICAYLQRLLSPHCQVDTVMDGEQALAVIGRRRPDLVLVDIMMPRLDGLTLLRALRADPRTATIPVILLSARAGEEARVEGLEAGADDYLVKPFVARELLARVEAHLKLARLRDEMHAALRESEMRFRNMADNSPVMIWVTEPEATCTYLNAAWYDFTGQMPEAALGFGWIDAVHPDDRKGTHDTFLAANAQRRAFRLEYRLRRRDGVYRWAIDQAAPRIGPQGEFLGYIGSVIDITELKQAEEALRDLNVGLEQRVAERTAALEQAHEALGREMAERYRVQEALFQQEKLAALGTLLANVAHELNNPLAVASMQLDTLHARKAAESWSEDLEILRQAVERCQSVVQSFLALARQQAPTRQAVTLQAVLDDVLMLLRHALEVDGITVEQHLADDLPLLWADPHQLHHVLANLLSNAQHALRQVEVPRHLRLTAAAHADRSQVILQVTDSGPGIPEDVRHRVFEPFFTTKSQGAGSGLGLPLCRSIVEGHGGTIHIDSQPGHGTTVAVTLPVAASEVRPLEAAPEPATPAQTVSASILLIDDEPGVQHALRRVLQRSGHEVCMASNGREGLAALEQRSYEAILCDMRMPDLDGPGFYRELEQRYPHLLSRIIFLTGDVLSPEAQAFFAQVDNRRLEKPFNAQKVRRVIQQMLEAQ